jgi:hypothetical protein
MLTLVMLASSVGFSVGSVACVKAAPKQIVMCPSCETVPTNSVERKSCCVYTLKYFCLKSELANPALNRQILLVASMSVSVLSTSDLMTMFGRSFDNCLMFHPPPFDGQRFLSTLRI